MKLVFNHLSLMFNNESAANAGVETFIRTIFKCSRFGLELILMDNPLDDSFFRIELATNYFWQNWFEWAKTEPALRDIVRAFRKVQTRKPLLLKDEYISNLGIEIGLADSDEGELVLLAAYVHESFLISFPTREPWINKLISAWKIDLDVSEAKELIEIQNIFNIESMKFYTPKLETLRNNSLVEGKDIWEKREEIFPDIILLDGIGEKLRRWTYNPSLLNEIRKTLFSMNAFADAWKRGDCERYTHDSLQSFGLSNAINGESLSVKNDPKKRKERMFSLDDGRKVFCENHVKYRWGVRLHFYVCSENKSIYVVYLGEHLRL